MRFWRGTGPAALLGNSFVKAIQLAKEDLKNTAHQYELVIEEISSPDKAEPAIQKLLKVDKVHAIIVGFSISGQIVKPYATAAKIPLFCIRSVGGVGDELYTFTIMPIAEDEAMQWVAEARRRGINAFCAEQSCAHVALPAENHTSKTTVTCLAGFTRNEKLCMSASLARNARLGAQVDVRAKSRRCGISSGKGDREKARYWQGIIRDAARPENGFRT
jgi:hypothetical protein